MISERELLRLVRPVSRSFYLSLIFLPEEVRKELTVGYLMARLADCIADYRGVVGWEQLSLLEELKRNYFRICATDGRMPVLVDEGEKRLLLACELLAEVFERSEQRDLLADVLGKILEGQIFDMRRRLSGGESDSLSSDEIIRYCENVAGSVGEFWVRILRRKGFIEKGCGEEELVRHGREYGIALQLVNIVRDRERDEEMGRIYLKIGDLSWAVERVEHGLDRGEELGKCLLGKRVRVATLLPCRLARRMLPDLRGKVSRKGVYWEILKLLLGI